MGKVFSSEELRRGWVPRLDSFGEVDSYFRRNLPQVPGIIGLIRCGSVLHGNHTIRSDADYALLYDPRYHPGVREAINKAVCFAAERYVPVQIIAIDKECAENGCHSISYGLFKHLEEAVSRGGLIGEDPLPYIYTRHLSPQTDLRSYVNRKVDKFREGLLTLSVLDDKLYEFLRKVFETPIHLARKLLAFENYDLPDDSKDTVIEAYLKYHAGEPARYFDHIVSINSWYDRALSEQVSQLNEHEYREIIHALAATAECSYRFIRLHALDLRNRPQP